MNTPPLLHKATRPTAPAFSAAAAVAEVVNAFSECDTTIQGTLGGGAHLICIEAGEAEILDFTFTPQGLMTGHRVAAVGAGHDIGPFEDAVGTHLWDAALEALPERPLTDEQLTEAGETLTAVRDQHTVTIQRLHLALVARKIQQAEPDLASFMLTRDGIEAGEDVALVAVMDTHGAQVDEDRTEELRVKYFAADDKTAEDYNALLGEQHSVPEAAQYQPSPAVLG